MIPAIGPAFGHKPVAFGNATPAAPAASQARIAELRRQHPVIDNMFDLIEIPSATPQKDPRFTPSIEGEMARLKALVSDKFRALGVTNITDESNGSLVVRIPGSPGLEKARPLMLTAHLDIVPGDPEDPTKPVKPLMQDVNGQEWIGTDGTTTLGSDDKGGLSMILDTVARLQGKHPAQLTPLPHAPLEILLSPDEESSCDSLKTLDSSQFKANHVLVVDEFDAFKLTTGLASAVDIEVSLSGLKGGHSGADIDKPNKVNGILLMAELAQALGTGVIKMDKANGIPLISKNIGMMSGGTAPNAIPEVAKMTVFLRSGSQPEQEKELARIQAEVARVQAKYQAAQPDLKVNLDIHEEYPAWQADPKSPIRDWGKTAAQAVPGAPTVDIGPIHAAAQASILANKQNAYGEQFDAVLIGPDIEEAHTKRERINWQSLVESSKWLNEIVRVYSKAQQGAS